MAHQWGYRREPSHAEAEEAIRELVWTLQQKLASYTHPSIRVNEVVKAGSMGHGTTVPGHFDIDLVLYSSDISGDVLKSRQGYSGYLQQLRSFITDCQIFKPGAITDLDITRYAVQFTFKDFIEVDLLVSPVWWDMNPSSPTKLFTFLDDRVPNDVEIRHRFSVNASKWQVAFMKKQDQRVKEYIVRAKAWRNRLWPKSEGGRGIRPSSYLISLLVLRAYENQQSRRYTGYSHNEARSTTEELKSIVRNRRSMNIYWEEYYRTKDYPSLFPSSTPRLVDPANPANNVYLSGIGPYPRKKKASEYDLGNGDWSQFETRVEYFDLEKSVEEITR